MVFFADGNFWAYWSELIISKRLTALLGLHCIHFNSNWGKKNSQPGKLMEIYRFLLQHIQLSNAVRRVKLQRTKTVHSH